MRYDILEYFSIYGTALSIWVSLMALAEFDEPKRSTFVMFGVLTIAVRIYHDRWGYGVYSGPIGTAVLVITVKWLQKMKEKKGLYPDKSVYTQQIGPGFCFGALALMLRFFFEVPVCRVNHPDFTRRKGHYQDRRPPPSHRWAASSLGQNPAQVRVSGVGVSGSGGRDEGPFLLVPVPAPDPLTAVWAGRGVTASDVQGDARSLFPLLSESQGHGPCFLQPYVILKMALSNASEVFWKLGTGDLRTPHRATAGTGYDPGMARSKAGSRQRKDSQLTPRGTRSHVYNLLLSPLAGLPVLHKRVRLSHAGKAITPPTQLPVTPVLSPAVTAALCIGSC
ncbi:protein myomaker isoform 3-T5 [Morphnus guianensis]